MADAGARVPHVRIAERARRVEEEGVDVVPVPGDPRRSSGPDGPRSPGHGVVHPVDVIGKGPEARLGAAPGQRPPPSVRIAHGKHRRVDFRDAHCACARAVTVGFRFRPAEGPTAATPLAARTFVPGQSMRLGEEAQLVTGDENVIEVAAVVTYRVADPSLFRFGVDRVDSVLRDLTRSFLVEEAGTMPIDAIYSFARGQAERAVLARLAACASLPEMGIRAEDVRLLYVHAPDEVHTAFRDVASAAEDRTTLRNKALVAAEGELGAARGDAARTVAEADSAKVRSVDTAEGDAAAFVPLAREVRAAPAISRFRLRIETLERSLASVPKLIRPAGGKVGSLELWIVPPGLGTGTAPAAGASTSLPGVPPIPGLSRLLDPIPAAIEEPVPEPPPSTQEPKNP